MIGPFKNEYAFLSNFHPCEIKHEGLVYPSVENAYQACKSTDQSDRERFCGISSAAAKKLGGRLIIRSDWESVKFGIMLDLLRLKFKNPDLACKLLSTGDEELVEVNWWGDHVWGVCKGEGQNWLGKLLMQVRDELRKS